MEKSFDMAKLIKNKILKESATRRQNYYIILPDNFVFPVNEKFLSKYGLKNKQIITDKIFARKLIGESISMIKEAIREKWKESNDSFEKVWNELLLEIKKLTQIDKEVKNVYRKLNV